MFKNNRKIIKSNKGFTFIEVIVVIVIVAVLGGAWFFSGRGHLKIAMTTEGRVLIDKIIAQERVYKARHSEFYFTPSSTGTVQFSGVLQVDARQNKYFKNFRTEGCKMTGNGKNLDGVKVFVYPKEGDKNLAGMRMIGTYYSDGSKTFEEIWPK